MKEKIFNMMTHKDGKRNEKSANLLFQKEIQDVDNTSYERKNLDDDIALEENPIQNLGIEFFPKKKSVSFRTQYNNDN
jgi:predicted DNA binding CopG/RHH family protein